MIDGSGNPRFDADVGDQQRLHRGDRQPRRRRRETEIDARGLFVAPGFINIHSHASPDALPTAVNMLTQGVTTEIFNADGSGPLDICAADERASASRDSP